MKQNRLDIKAKENYRNPKNKRKLVSLLTIFIVFLISAEVLGIVSTFVFYRDEDETLYYNKTRLLCADKLNEINEKFKLTTYSFESWKYPYAVIDNSGKVLYSSDALGIHEQVNLQSFLQFDRSTSLEYKGFVKSSFPIVIDNENKGFFIAFINIKDLQEKTTYQRKMEIIYPQLILIIFSIVMFIIFRIYVVKYVLKPILKITNSSKDIIKGRFDNYITFNSDTEIGELSYAFELMRDEIKSHREREEKLKKSQKEIIAAISHDLKTPLSAIRIYVEAIRDGMAEKEEDRYDYTATILRKVDTLNKLIDDLLEHSKESLEVLSINKKEVSIKPFLEKLIGEINMELLRVNAEFCWDKYIPEGIVSIDEIRINQVIFNLISNSIKYSKENLKIKFKAEIKNRYLFIYIEDNGIGILQEDISYIFNKFYRGDKSRNYRIPGSGLGLSTCKYIVEKHLGEIYCKTIKSGGSIFYFSIPLS